MNAEFFAAVEDIEKEKGIPRGYMFEKIQQAMLAAFRKDNPEYGENVEVILDEGKKRIELVINKTVVDEVEDPTAELDLDSAHKLSKKAKVGDVISIPVETKKFGRIAAQAAKQVIIQGIREAERSIIYDEFTSKEHEILTGVVSRIEPRTGGVSIKISSNSEFTEAMLSASERIKGEELHEGDRIKVYVVEVRKYRFHAGRPQEGRTVCAGCQSDAQARQPWRRRFTGFGFQAAVCGCAGRYLQHLLDHSQRAG